MFEKLVSKGVSSLVPYPPGKPIEELEREMGISGAVKLASNENPLGPSPKALAAMTAALPNLHRYPDGRGYYLKEALAAKLGLDMEEIVLGNGSNEIIELAVRTFLRPGARAVFSDPTFLVYAKVVQGADGEVTQVPLKNHRHDLKGLLAAVDEKTRLVFIDNPNNPTGTLIPPGDLNAFMADLPDSAVLVLDEAYVDFVRDGKPVPAADMIHRDLPVILLRTFSKAYGLAGLRIGFGLADRRIVDFLDRVRQPFNVNTLAQIGAMAALGDDEFYRRTIEITWSELDRMTAELAAMGLKPFPTQTNFMMVRVPGAASEIADRMLRQGVIIRSLKSYGLDDVIRFNAGLPEENDRFLAALKKVLSDR